MHTQVIPVCRVNYFNGGRAIFHMSSTCEISEEKYPLLFRSFRAAFYMLLFVRSGRGCVKIDQHKVILDKHQVLILKPGNIVQFDSGNQVEGTYVAFDESFFTLRYHDNVLRGFDFLTLQALPFAHFSRAKQEKMGVVLKLMMSEYESQKRDALVVLRSYLNILLFELNELIDPVVSGEGTNNMLKKVLDFEDLVERHFREVKTPSFYAEKLCLSPNYLNKICKIERGVTAGELIRRRVVIEAQRFLQFTKYNVNEIALELNFDNPSYFVTFFKKHTGHTPENYRKQMK